MRAYKKLMWMGMGIVLVIVAGIGIVIKERTKPRKFTGDETVRLVKSSKSYQLLRYGKPYYIKGAAVYDCSFLKQLKECGANSIRIYNTNNAQQILDSAYKLGLTVTVGLALGYAERDLDYGDDDAVAAQLERLKLEVLKYKDHPALLMWGIGNEVSLFLRTNKLSSFKHIQVWKAVNDIALMIHKVDGNHLTTTSLQQARNAMLFISIYCNGIDIVSVNSFDSFPKLKKRIDTWLFNKPYMVTEFGPKAYWLMNKTDWYSHPEQSSWEKAQYIEELYSNIKTDTAKCLGSYIFFWGYKNEFTPTMFSLFTKRGEPMAMIDIIQKMWSGQTVSKNAPIIYSLKINNRKDSNNIYLENEKKYQATLIIDTAFYKSLFLRWELRKDDIEYLDASYTPSDTKIIASDSIWLSNTSEKVPVTIHKPGELSLTFTTSKERGPYRLYFYLKNRSNKVATINSCFYVQ